MKKIITACLILSFIIAPYGSFIPVANAGEIIIGNDAIARPNLDLYTNFTIIDTNHPAFKNGFVESFGYYASNTNSFRFVLVNSSTTVKWVSDLVTPPMIGVNNYSPVGLLSVATGDRLGLYFTATGTIPFDVFGAQALITPNNSGVPVVGNQLILEGSLSRTYSLNASIATTTIPTLPVFQSPANGATITKGNNINLDWTNSTSSYLPVKYRLQIFNNSAYTNSFLLTDWLNLSEYSWLTPPEGSYYARVMARDDQGNESAWSNSSTTPYWFKVQPQPSDDEDVPTDKNQCKRNGWKEMEKITGHKFRSQGECVSYVVSRSWARNYCKQYFPEVND